MTDVFISYASVDRAKAKQLAEHLEQHGLSVWWDRTIPPGRVFDEVIQEALNASACVVVLWSATSIASNWVKAESSDALARHCLVPALIEKVSPPFEFRRIQAADLTHWDGQEDYGELANLLAAVEQLVRRPTPANESTNRLFADMSSKKPASSRISQLVLAAAIVLLGFGVVISNLKGISPSLNNTGSEQGVTSEQSAVTSAASAGSIPIASASVASTKDVTNQRINLLLPENGGQLLAASTDKWSTLIKGEGETSIWIDSGVGVFGFKDGRAARFDTFAVLIPETSDNNVKDFELYSGTESATGHFDLIGKFTAQNIRLMQQPFQEFHFTPVTAKYLKVHALNNYAGSNGAVLAYRFQLFGALQ